MLKNGSIIQVFGWVMLKGVPGGQYRVETGRYLGLNTYTFFRPNGKKAIAKHFASSVDAWVRPVGHEDENRIEVW